MGMLFSSNSFYFIEMRTFAWNGKFSNKKDLKCAWRDFKKKFFGISTYHNWMFKLQISSIFNFDRAHQSWISGVLGVNSAVTYLSANDNKGRTYSSKHLVCMDKHCTKVVLRFFLTSHYVCSKRSRVKKMLQDVVSNFTLRNRAEINRFISLRSLK